VICDSGTPPDVVETLGWMLAEKGYAVAFFVELGVRCRQANSAGQYT